MPRLLLTAATLLYCGVGAAAPSALEPRVLGNESFTEILMAMADLDDGGYVQVQLVISNVGAGDGHGACRALITEPRAAPLSVAHKVGKDWKFVAGPPESLQMTDCSARGGESLSVEMKLEKGERLSLVLHAAPGSTRPPGGRIDVDDDFYDTEIVVPWARATVTRTAANGTKTVTLGNGYADHFRSTALPASLATRWLRFRSTGPECATLFLARYAPGAPGPSGWVWQSRSEDPQPLDAGSITVRSGAGPGLVEQIRVEAMAAQVTLEPGLLLYRHAPVEEYGMLGRLVGRYIGNPVTSTYRATLRSGTCPPATGILEITDVRK